MRFSLEVNPRLTRQPALDGLRGLAVIAVMLFHARLVMFRGGILGVDVFFVLSGFLITTLLLQEWAARGDIALRAFYVRRSLRLLPAVVVVVAAYAAVNAATGTFDSDTAIRVLAALTYWFNWLCAFHYLPNDEISALWSLAVEEQFYLIWPGLLLLLLKLRWSPPAIMALTVVVIGLSAALPMLPGMPSRGMYFRTDFRLQELMVGALLAQLYVAGVLRRETVKTPVFRVLLTISTAALTWQLLSFGDPVVFLRNGGHLLAALCAAVVVFACVFVEGGRAGGVMCSRALVYAGSRSYALYLWHLPLSAWLPRLISTNPLLWFLGWLVLAFIAAELSHRLVEGPALRLKDRLIRPAAPAPETTVEPRSTYTPDRRSRWLPGVGADARPVS